MPLQLKTADRLPEKQDTVYIVKADQAASVPGLSEPEQEYVRQQLEGENKQVTLNRYTHQWHLVVREEKPNPAAEQEALRKAGFELHKKLKAAKVQEVYVSDQTDTKAALFLAEGLGLTNYEFNRYKSDTSKAYSLVTVYLHGSGVSQEEADRLSTLLEAVHRTRDLVNEPPNVLTAKVLSERLEELGKEAGYTTDILDELKIKSLKMGGLLSVNQGSSDPPTFSILEWKPEDAQNQKPYVLVGKGVVYDTGGLSIKPTPNSMDYMKCDMAGAAAAAGVVYAIAKNKLPLHVIALIPATDNRVSATSFSPGDVITMYSGKTVEVLNTDAEGRLLLADALCFAQKYNPELVIDIATLTGAAARAIGKEGIVMMTTAPKEVVEQFKKSGENVYERLVEFPLWEEYGEMIKSDVADIKNIGGADAGAITAGKFLEKFTDYPWIHLDIAGPAFLSAVDSYRGKQGTGTSLRLMYDFLTSKVQEKGKSPSEGAKRQKKSQDKNLESGSLPFGGEFDSQ
jgi:leucyl aminopeptidase